MKQILAATFLLVCFRGLPNSCARPQMSLAELMQAANYQLVPPIIPIRITACPTCQLLGYRPMEFLQGSSPFMTALSNANNNGNILTDRVPGDWSSFLGLNRLRQPVQLPTSTLVSALISYINYLRQNLDSISNAHNNCSNPLPSGTSDVSTIQPTAANTGDVANETITSAPTRSRLSSRSKPTAANDAVSVRP